MFRVLTATTAPTELELTTLARAKSALGVGGTGDDAKITEIIKRVSEAAISYMRVPECSDGTYPHLGRGTYKETMTAYTRRFSVFLSRRPIVSVSSVTVGGVELAATEYIVNKRSAQIARVDEEGRPIPFSGDKIVVDYVAGYILPSDAENRDLPHQIEEAVIYAVKARMSDMGIDPNPEIKREKIDGAFEVEYVVSGVTRQGASALPQKSMHALASYRYPDRSE